MEKVKKVKTEVKGKEEKLKKRKGSELEDEKPKVNIQSSVVHYSSVFNSEIFLFSWCVLLAVICGHLWSGCIHL